MCTRAGACACARRDVTKELKKALKAVEKAEEHMYNKADKLEEEDQLRESSVKEAMQSLGGWRAHAPTDYAAEFFQMGTHAHRKYFTLSLRCCRFCSVGCSLCLWGSVYLFWLGLGLSLGLGSGENWGEWLEDTISRTWTETRLMKKGPWKYNLITI